MIEESTPQLLGSKLEIKSRKGLNYTGVLHALDTKHLTLTLSNVSVWGEVLDKEMNFYEYEENFAFVVIRDRDMVDFRILSPVTKGSLIEHDGAIVLISEDRELPASSTDPLLPISFHEALKNAYK
ncbi:hypothetical protein Ciccas_009434 [Cichlidogyrus casuarinus]|uniref:Lsm14-like N-terminal domain-containing protein n=1 Tax=Cichlidogyrus casuarinus TaxID=1844966 RepID=A0ABD2PYG5_9PLAT